MTESTAAPVATSAKEAQAAPNVPAQSAEQGKESTKDAKVAQEVAKEIRRLKLKVDGREEELPEDEVIRLAQLGRGAGKRFQEAAQQKQQAEQFMRMLREDPKSVLSNPNLGIDMRKLAEEIVWEKMQEEALTPEQKKARDLEKQLQEYKEKEKKAESERAEERQRALHEKYATDYDRKITAALQSSGLPKTPMTVKRMAEYMFNAISAGYDVDPSDVVTQVRKDYEDDLRQLFGQTDEDAILSVLGEDIAKKLRKADMKRLKSTTGPVIKDDESSRSRKSKEMPKRLKGADWRESLMKEMRGR